MTHHTGEQPSPNPNPDPDQSQTPTPPLVQLHYKLVPRADDDCWDTHQYDFGPEGSASRTAMVDLQVAAGVSYPTRLGIQYAVKDLPSRVSLQGEIHPGVLDADKLGVIALTLANTFVQIKETLDPGQAPTA